MTLIFLAVAYIAILIQGVHAVTRQDKLLSFLGAYPKAATRFGQLNKVGALIWHLIKPFAPALTECTTCMASFWTLLVSILHFTGFLYIQLAGIPIILVFFLMLQVAGLGDLLASIRSIGKLSQSTQLIALNTSAINQNLQHFNELQTEQIINNTGQYE